MEAVSKPCGGFQVTRMGYSVSCFPPLYVHHLFWVLTQSVSGPAAEAGAKNLHRMFNQLPGLHVVKSLH